VVDGLAASGWAIDRPQGTMFVWAALPNGYADSERFALELMESAGVITVPGVSFGERGEGHVRIALVQLEDGIHSICVMGGKLLAFSGDTMYTYKATGELESQRALPVDRVVRVIKLSETRFLMQRGGSLYLVSL